MINGDSIITLIDADGTEFDLYTPEAEGPFIILEGATGLDMAAVAVDARPRVGAGSSLAGSRMPARTIVLPIYAEDLDVLDEFAESIPERGNRLRITTLDRQRELLDVYYVAGLEGVHASEVGGDDWRRFDLELIVLDPLYRDDEEAITLFPPEVNDDYDAALPYDMPLPYDGPGGGISGGHGYDEPIPYDSDLPYDGGGLVAPVITSKLGAWPTFTFHGPALSFQVVHLRSGERIWSRPETMLAAGAELVVTTAPAGRDVTIGGRPAWDQVTDDSSATMQFLPDDRLAVLMTGTTAESFIRISWQQMWRQP